MGGARICLGQIGAAHGLRGEVRLRSFTSDPEAIARYGPLETDDGRCFEIEALRPARDHFVARLSGVTDRDAAAKLTNLRLYVPRERLPPPAEADEFYHADLIGLAAVDPAGHPIGIVIAIHNFGAGDLLEVKPDAGGQTQLVPFDAAHVPAVDVAAGRLVVAVSLLAGDDADGAGPRRMRAPAKPGAKAAPRARTGADSRRQRSALSPKASR